MYSKQFLEWCGSLYLGNLNLILVVIRLKGRDKVQGDQTLNYEYQMLELPHPQFCHWSPDIDLWSNQKWFYYTSNGHAVLSYSK